MKKTNILLSVSLILAGSSLLADNPFSALGRAVGGAVEGATYVAGEAVETVGDVVPPLEPITDATGEVIEGTGRAVGGTTRAVTGNDFDDSYIYDNDDVIEEERD